MSRTCLHLLITPYSYQIKIWILVQLKCRLIINMIRRKRRMKYLLTLALWVSYLNQANLCKIWIKGTANKRWLMNKDYNQLIANCLTKVMQTKLKNNLYKIHICAKISYMAFSKRPKNNINLFLWWWIRMNCLWKDIWMAT